MTSRDSVSAPYAGPVIASHRHRFVFLKTRKTAGTSVEIALSRHCGPDDVITPVSPADEVLRIQAGGVAPQNFESPPLARKAYNHISAPRARVALGAEVFDAYFKFAVERNPWDAVVSAYYWTMRDRPEPEAFEEWVYGDQVEHLARNERRYRIDGELVADRVLRYERLDADLAEVWSHLGLPGSPDLPRAKGGARPGRTPYQEMFTPVSRDHVGEVFVRVIEAFGYAF